MRIIASSHHGARAVPVACLLREPSLPMGSPGGFYRDVMKTLAEADIPFLVGGTYALASYTGVARPTKDLDLFLGRDALEPALDAIERKGYRTEITHPHFLGKAYA